MTMLLQQILDLPLIRQVRRNHALEHATVHILSQRHPGVTIYARSQPSGLVVFGDLPTEEVAKAIDEALTRLRAGEYQLAIHPNCGTNLVTAGGLSGLAAVLAMRVQQIGRKKRDLRQLVSSLPLVILAATAALLFAQPLGQTLQLYVTTDAEIGTLHVTEIGRRSQGKLVFHVVNTAT
jgi:hypothetical protein